MSSKKADCHWRPIPERTELAVDLGRIPGNTNGRKHPIFLFSFSLKKVETPTRKRDTPKVTNETSPQKILPRLISRSKTSQNAVSRSKVSRIGQGNAPSFRWIRAYLNQLGNKRAKRNSRNSLAIKPENSLSLRLQRKPAKHFTSADLFSQENSKKLKLQNTESAGIRSFLRVCQ